MNTLTSAISRVVAIVVLLVPGVAANEPIMPPAIQLDGVFDDWENDLAATDPTGDATGAFDLVDASAKMDGATLYLRLRMTTKLNLAAGGQDQGTLIVNIDLSNDRQLSIDLRGRQANLITSSETSTIGWSTIRFAALPTYASTNFEIRCDLGPLGVTEGTPIAVTFNGSDQFESGPITLLTGSTTNQANIEPDTAPDLTRRQGTQRIVSINTLASGMGDPKRAPALAKLLAAVGADVICFNEEWDEPSFRYALPNVLESSRYTGLWSNGCAIVTKRPMVQLPFQLNRGVAALIEFDDRKDLVIVSVHFKCCGSMGSLEDFSRMQEASELMSEISQMRRGKFGRQAKEADVIILGDYNLVGSRLPLDVIEAGGMRSVMLRSPRDGSALTWEGLTETESFWPGRLDWATVSSGFQVVQGLVIDASMVDAGADRVSDHRMLVIDAQLDSR